MATSIKGLFNTLLKGRKINTFLIFFIVSFLVWTLVKLSATYAGTIKMRVQYTNLSEDKILLGNQDNFLEAQIKTTGFRMISQKIFKKNVKVDLAKINKAKQPNAFYVLTNNAINKHLYQETEVLRVSPDTLFFKLGKNKIKKVPVISQLELNFQNGYNLYDSLLLKPNFIKISGPEDLVDKVDTVYTIKKKINKINTNINSVIQLIKNDSLARLQYTVDEVQAIAKVDKFTEGKLNIPLRITNLPKGYSIKLFPKQVEVVFTANISDFNAIKENDFAFVCDYKEIENSNETYFIPKLLKKPKKVKTFRLTNEKINFLIKK